MKKYRKFGYEGLAEVYVKARKEGYSRTYDSMCKIIRKMKGNAKEKPKKQHKRKKKVEQAKYPGERVQIDIKYVPEECIQFGTRDQKYYQITALDEYTRKRVLRIADEKSTYQTAKFLENLERELGFDIKKVQTDNGKEFTNSESDKKTLFELKLEEKGIEYVTTRPYSPWENGKVERSHRLDSKYYADKKFKSKEELLRAIRKYNTRYNNISRKVLGFKSPNEVLKEYKENQ
ncbi:transposase [Leptotrichia hongkongensis]|nr:DDE-type integrase/transposase/recombinase [Leptotrichia hongkongensis]BBM58666.1 transposase [Leptotrichia hongkongensis]